MTDFRFFEFSGLSSMDTLVIQDAEHGTGVLRELQNVDWPLFCIGFLRFGNQKRLQLPALIPSPTNLGRPSSLILGHRRGPGERSVYETRFLAFLANDAAPITVGFLDFSGYMSFSCPVLDHVWSLEYMKDCVRLAATNPNFKCFVIPIHYASPFVMDFVELLPLTKDKPVCLDFRGDPSDHDGRSSTLLSRLVRNNASYGGHQWEDNNEKLSQFGDLIQGCKNIEMLVISGSLDTKFATTFCAALARRNVATIQHIRINLKNSGIDASLFFLGQSISSSPGFASTKYLSLEEVHYNYTGLKSILEGSTGNNSIESINISSGNAAASILDRCLGRMASLTNLTFEGKAPSPTRMIRLLQSRPWITSVELWVDRNLDLELLLAGMPTLKELTLHLRKGVGFHHFSTKLYNGLMANNSLKKLAFSKSVHLNANLGFFRPFVASASANHICKLEELTVETPHLSVAGVCSLLQVPDSTLTKLFITASRDFYVGTNLSQLVLAVNNSDSLQFLRIKNFEEGYAQDDSIPLAMASLHLKWFEYYDSHAMRSYPGNFPQRFLTALRRNGLVEHAVLSHLYYETPWSIDLKNEIEFICHEHALHNNLVGEVQSSGNCQ